MKASRRHVLGLALAVPFMPCGLAAAEPADGSLDLDSLVASVAFSPDARTIAGGGRQLRLWDLASGRLLKTFDEGTGAVSSVAFSPDGRFVACGSGNAATVRLQDVLHDKLAWGAEPGPVATLAFSHDGRSLVSGGLPFEFKQWDVATGRIVREFEGHSEAVQSIAFSPDDRLIASGAEDGTVKLWDAGSGKALATFPAGGTPFGLVFAPDGLSVVWATTTDTAFVVARANVAGGRPTQLMASATKGRNFAYRPTLSRDGGLLLVSYADRIELLDTSTGKPRRTIRASGTNLDPLAFSADGKLIAKGTEKNTLEVWDVSSGAMVSRMQV